MAADRMDCLLSNEQLLPLLPVLYIAWADIELTPSECQRLRELAVGLPTFDTDAQATLDRWLEPQQPPTVTELARLRHRIQQAAGRRQTTLAAVTAAMRPDTDDDLIAAVATYAHEREISDSGALAAIFNDSEQPVRQDFAEQAASFEPAELQAVLEGDYAPEWALVRDILASEAFQYDYGDSIQAHRGAVTHWLNILAERGLGAYAMPATTGGQADMPAFIHLFQALAMFDLSLVVKFGVQFGLFGGSILFLGTAKHHRKYLSDIASMQLPGGFAMTESGHGSNVRALETTATYDASAGEFVIHSPTLSARKEWIGNAACDGHCMTVFAQLNTSGENYGVHAFVVPIRDAEGRPKPGVRIEDCGHKMGLNGVDNGRLYFDNVRIPRDNLLDRYASVSPEGDYDSPITGDDKRFFTMLGTLVGGRISVAAASVTAARKALAIAIRYGALRRQFGSGDGTETRILDYKTHQARLFPALAHNFALHFAVADLIEQFRQRTQDTAREVETLAAGIKSMASWHAIHACQMARECCGGLGFLSENQIAIIRRDVDVFATFEGDNTVLMQLLAKNRLSGYAKNFEQDLVISVIRQLRIWAKTELLEGNPIIARRTSEAHLRDANFHQEVLSLRARNQLVSAARRIRKRIDNDIEPFTAFNQIQDHLLAYAQSEMQRHAAVKFAQVVARMADGPAKAALETMRQLWAVDVIYNDSAWYLHNGYFRPEKHRALRKLRLKLLTEVRPDALAYIDSFAIPDDCLSAPIAFADYIGKPPRNSGRI